jgi:hypothetical protein
MALTYPLSVATFMDALLVGQASFALPEQVQVDRTAGGEILSADIGERLWAGNLTMGRLLKTETGRIEVLIDLLRPAGRSFMVFDIRRPAPLLDPLGTTLGAATPTILALGSDARELSLAGLPAGYVLSAGDYLAFSYGTSPVRFALHRVVPVTVAASGAGQTALFEVTPAIRPGASAGAAITLKKASCKALMVPGSMNPGNSSRTVTDGIAFDWQQTLG